MHRKVAAVIAAVAALAVGGCGGEDALTRAELVRQGDVICRQEARQTNTALTTAGKQAKGHLEENAELIAGMLAKVKRYRESAATQLDGLEPPAELQPRYDKYVAGMRDLAKLLPTVEALQTGKDPNTRAREARGQTNRTLAKAIGFKSCT